VVFPLGDGLYCEVHLLEAVVFGHGFDAVELAVEDGLWVFPDDSADEEQAFWVR
jgi:hypothetical protein